jgi:hypothetical protein
LLTARFLVRDGETAPAVLIDSKTERRGTSVKPVS